MKWRNNCWCAAHSVGFIFCKFGRFSKFSNAMVYSFLSSVLFLQILAMQYKKRHYSCDRMRGKKVIPKRKDNPIAKLWAFRPKKLHKNSTLVGSKILETISCLKKVKFSHASVHVIQY